MEKVKSPSVAGQFYTADAAALTEQIHDFSERRTKDREITSRLVIAPHAGYIYSGQLMSESIGYLPDGIKTVFVIAPAHRVPFVGLALSSFDAWKTPLGEIKLNRTINEALITDFSCKYNDEAFAPEHAVEVEVPFLQSRYPEGIELVPILVGRVVPGKITDIISRYYADPSVAFVISSDLSHFLTSDKARRLDDETAKMIETGDIDNFRTEQACGALGIFGAVHFARRRGWSMIRAGMFNSGDVTSDKSRVVGYGSWFLYEGSKEKYFKEYYSPLIIDAVRKSISAGLDGQKKLTKQSFDTLPHETVPAAFDEAGACFVTLEIDHRLRGCIGSIIAQTTFIDDLLSNAWNAAFGDPRFPPLTQDEFKKISIAVSLLSPPVPIQFGSEEEMMSQIKPFRDGVIIADGYRRAVYLPSVWEQIPDKTTFIRNLKIKAGMSPDHFSKTFVASLFTTEYVKETDLTAPSKK